MTINLSVKLNNIVMSDEFVEHDEELYMYSSKKGRRDFCLTFFSEMSLLENWLKLNNKTNPIYYLKSFDFTYLNQIKFFVSCIEYTPTTNRLYFQSYVFYHNAKTRDQSVKFLKKLFNREISHKCCKKTFEENIAYCSKDGNRMEYGKRPREGQGKRTDLISLPKFFININDALKF